MTTTYKDPKPPKDVRQDVALALIELIEQGTPPWQRQWDPSLGDDTPVNAVTGKRYRGINNIWLSLNQPSPDPRWCTFNQAREEGWQIRKGCHGVSVEKWMVVDKSKDIKINGEPATVEEKSLRVRFYTVFHASQIERIPELVPQERIDAPLEPDKRVAFVVEERVARNGARHSPPSLLACYVFGCANEVDSPMSRCFPADAELFSVVMPSRN